MLSFVSKTTKPYLRPTIERYPMSVLYLFRHGQASWGKSNYDQLSDLGQEQARLLGTYFKQEGVFFDHTYTGTLMRQIDTTTCFRDGYGQDFLNKTIPELNEHHGPQIQNVHLRQAIEQDLKLKNLIEAHGNNHILTKKEVIKTLFKINVKWAMGELDSGEHEDWNTFRKRIDKAFSIIEPDLQRGQNFAIFTSGGVIAMLVGMALGLDNRTIMETNWQIRNASITEIHYTRERMFLRMFNAIPHLTSRQLVTYV